MESDNIYINGQYLKNNSTWGVEDSIWKSDMIIKLLQTNKIEPAEVIDKDDLLADREIVSPAITTDGLFQAVSVTGPQRRTRGRAVPGVRPSPVPVRPARSVRSLTAGFGLASVTVYKGFHKIFP